MRQMTDQRHDTVMGVRIDSGGHGADASDEAVQALVVGRIDPWPEVRNQVALSKSSSRAFTTPAVSAPQTGWPPMKRFSSAGLSAAIRLDLVLPISVTMQAGPEATSACRAIASNERTGVARKTISVPETASSILPNLVSDGAHFQCLPQAAFRAAETADAPDTQTFLGRQASEPPISPTPMMAMEVLEKSGMAVPAAAPL